MPRAISTAVSDLVLASVALHCTMKLLLVSQTGAIGFALIAVAAGLGTARFAMDRPDINLIQRHKYFSWLSTVLGMSLIACAYHREINSNTLAHVHLAAGAALPLVSQSLSESIRTRATEVVSTAAVISIALVCLFRLNIVGVIGAVLFALSGLYIGTNGEWNGIPRVDLFHYALAIGVIALRIGLTAQETAIFY